MNETARQPVSALPGAGERKILLLLCLLAAVHVFIFSAAFPFFNVVDEQLHFDTVVKYSHGEVPRALEMPHPEALQFISVYGTIEYLWSPEMLADKKIPPPPWTLPMDQVAQNLLAKEAVWKEKVKNTESSQPPLYYSLAAAWWRLGKTIGLDGGTLLYWLRFMNIPVMIALVWLGWYSARLVFPDDIFERLGVPALIAVLPQTAFYAIQNDVLSPLCFGLAFVGLVKLLRADLLDLRLAAFTGLALAATFLVKISNLPLLAVSAAAVLLKTFQLARAGKLPASLAALLTLALCASLPAAAWMVWCKMNFGDFTGTAAKIQILGWTRKPVAEWWHHPIFTPHGLWTFFSGVMATFWQGELLWNRRPLALPAANLIYTLFSLILAGLALFNLRPHSKSLAPPQRQALWLGFACFAAVVVFLGVLSIIYDFHDCFYPSRAHPYFTSGRLMLGALIPILLLFVFGLDRTMKNLKTATKFCVLAGIMLFMLVTEITTDWAIFPNAYNWFHM